MLLKVKTEEEWIKENLVPFIEANITRADFETRFVGWLEFECGGGHSPDFDKNTGEKNVRIPKDINDIFIKYRERAVRDIIKYFTES